MTVQYSAKAGMRMPSCSRVPRAIIAMLLMGCSEATEPVVKPVTTGAPAVVDHSIALDYDEQLGTFTLTAADPDTVTAIECEGAFVGSGQNTVAISRPFVELRHHQSSFDTTCRLEAAGDTAVHVPFRKAPDVTLDSLPVVTWPTPAAPPRVGVPVQFTMQAVDDWGITEHWIYYARGNDIYECSQQWLRARTTELTVPARDVFEAITLTFSEPGHYCIGFTVRDDFTPVLGSGHVAGAVNEIDVAPE